ncbi:MAG: branched-chain amino acid ABC transporter substrate-binding protein [Ketobacter sp.]|nr:MAG: branched-chain amino acid ABC transporter substrate-binding protein [Ketobacter sp.]
MAAIGSLATLSWSLPGVAAPRAGVDDKTIYVGGVLDLEGQSRGLGQGMRDGIEAAFRGVQVRGRSLKYVTVNDSYTPELTVRGTQQLIDSGIFAMLGNVGTPTAKVALPILAQNEIPAVGFFTGAGLLRPGEGDVINYRASYIEEAAAVIDQALDNGMDVDQICAYVQNDAYGMAGVEGIKMALKKRTKTRQIIERLDQILALDGDNPARNNIGPVGVYQRNTLTSRDGYESLKHWEQQNNVQCRLVISVGTYNAVGRFVGYSRYKGEDWLVSAVSFTGADNIKNVLTQFGVQDRFIMTQVVPPLDEKLPIIQEAKTALGSDFGYVSLEGYIVGKMFIAILNNVEGELNRQNFVKAAKGNSFNIGGLDLSFRRNNQGSTLVSTTYFNGAAYVDMDAALWKSLL